MKKIINVVCVCFLLVLSFFCSACSLIDLVQYDNIKALKLSLRGRDIKSRVRQLNLVQDIVSAAKNKDRDKIKEIVNSSYPTACRENSCLM